MKIAFPTNDGVHVEEHFGHSKQFMLCTVEEGVEWVRESLNPPAHVPGAFPRFLSEKGANVIITGGMGQRAVSLFENENIQVVLGATGTIDDNLKKFVAEELVSTGSSCSHDHGEGHGDSGHSCHNN